MVYLNGLFTLSRSGKLSSRILSIVFNAFIPLKARPHVMPARSRMAMDWRGGEREGRGRGRGRGEGGEEDEEERDD